MSFTWLTKIASILSATVLLVIGYGYISSNSENSSPNFINLSTTSPNKQTFIPPRNPVTPRLPLVLAYNTFFGSSIFNSRTRNELKNCKYDCRYSENKALYPQADAVIFHARDFKMDPMLYSNIKPDRLNIFYALEAAPNEKIISKRIPKDFFNVSMTFRKDSTIWRPYDKFEEIQPHEQGNKNLVWSEEQIEKKLAKKTKLALQFVSNCRTNSKREKYLAVLERYENLTIFGKCNNQPFPNNRSMAKQFAFENAVCDDYVTEKFWRLKNLIVPVVLKRSILNGIIDDEYFIAADDFASPEALIERLQYLSENPEEYKKYFGWTKKYKKTTATNLDNFCKICEMATKKEKHRIENIQKWWELDANCKTSFAQRLIGKTWL